MRLILDCPNGLTGTYSVIVNLEKHFIVIADVPENTGMSSTNCFESLAFQLWDEVLKQFFIAPTDVNWYQRDTEGLWSIVKMPWLGTRYGSPSWELIKEPPSF